MLRLSRKFIAVLLLFWLPLSGASALAASLSMQVPHKACHQAAMQMESHEHHHDAAMDQGTMHEAASQDQPDTSCNACGVCHLACSGYLAVPGVLSLVLPQASAAVTPYLFSFYSITTTPLDPPPLARS